MRSAHLRAARALISSMAASEKAIWYFIDAENEFRGPVTEATMHYLYSNGHISMKTYVFSEHADCNQQWVRLKRMPELAAALTRPRALSQRDRTSKIQYAANVDDADATVPLSPSSSARNEVSEVSSAAGTKPAASALSSTAAASAAMAAPSPPPPTQSPTSAAAIPASPDTPTSELPPARLPGRGGEGSSQADSLFQYFASSPKSAGARTGVQARSSTGRLWPFSGRRSSSKSVALIGQPLLSCQLDESGVPVALAEMRRQLFGVEGHLEEGIFRLNAGAAAKKAARQHADAGQLAKVRDPACLSALIKSWFAELPESVLSPCLQAVVDGPPDDAAGCVALVDALPDPNRATVRWLCALMREIARYEHSNRMTHKALAVVFAPNLVEPPASMPPMLTLELNHRVVAFLERVLEGGSGVAQPPVDLG